MTNRASFGPRSTLWRWLVQRRVESVHSAERRQSKRVGRILKPNSGGVWR